MVTDPPSLSEPELPPPLINACARGDCVLYAGAGLAARTGFPTYRDFLVGLQDWATKKGLISSEASASYLAGIEHNDLGSTADALVTDLQSHPSELNDYLRSVFIRPVPSLSDAHKLLTELPFSAALTTNFDDLLEHAFSGRNPQTFTPEDAKPLSEAIHKRDFFVLKLYGDLKRPQGPMISPAQFEDAVRENKPFAECMERIFFTRSILFLGCSLEGIEDYLKGVALWRQTGDGRHFALVGPLAGGWQNKASGLERRYGIQVLPYFPTRRYPELIGFLTKLIHEVHATSGTTPKKQRPNHLRRAVLENIGPFDRLELDFDRHWNILLGDNGVGKSVILRAIGAAICGADAEPYASRLVKTGKTNATITLEIGRNKYQTEILLNSSGSATLRSKPTRPLDAEGWLALGFPPLRTGSWDRPKSPEISPMGVPTSDDILPLVAGACDLRLDRLKQWVVNLDYRSKAEQIETGTGGRFERMLNQAFELIGRLAEGVKIGRGEVNPKTFEISVMTDDGKLPIEAISQGTTSLIGWVGIILQRLYEVYSVDDDPTSRYTLVLMDEIDAHLHPSWQQKLISRLSEILPNAQFIATTHSPLIVGGLPPNQLVRFARNEDGRVVQLSIEPDMMMGRTDQILTTDLFGLKTTFDTQTQEVIEQYKRLLGKAARTEEEEKEFNELRVQLQFRIPSPALNLEQRRAEDRETDSLIKRVEEKVRASAELTSQST